MRKPMTWMFLAAWLAAFPGARRGWAEVSEITVAIAGMSCPFCTFGVEKKLRQLPGVERVEIDLEAGTASITPAKSQPPTLESIRQAVDKAGFTPGQVELTVLGSVSLSGHQLLLQVRGGKQRFVLSPPGGSPGAAFAPKLRERLSGLAAADGVLAIHGRLQAGRDGSEVLSVDTLAPVHALTLRVEGMACEKCVARLTKLLLAAPGVEGVSVSLEPPRARVEFLADRLDPAPLIAIAEDAGFEASLDAGGAADAEGAGDAPHGGHVAGAAGGQG